jgi:short-subunit dehydrogenase
MANSEQSALPAKYGAWACIAGASGAGGLGVAYAAQAAAQGFNIVLIARRAEKLAEAKAHLLEHFAVEVRVIVADLEAAEAPDIIEAATRDLEIGLFIYNAALVPQGRFLALDAALHRRTLAVNCLTPTLLAHQFGRAMAARGRGAIVLISSGAALQGSKTIACYAAAKAYALILGEGLWDELREAGVDALSYVVAATATPEYLARTAKLLQSGEHIPGDDAINLSRPKTPAEVAAELFRVLSAGPRRYSHPAVAQKAQADAALTRGEVVEKMGRILTQAFGG